MSGFLRIEALKINHKATKVENHADPISGDSQQNSNGPTRVCFHHDKWFICFFYFFVFILLSLILCCHSPTKFCPKLYGDTHCSSLLILLKWDNDVYLHVQVKKSSALMGILTLIWWYNNR